MTNKWNFMSAALFGALIVSFPLMAQEAAKPRNDTTPKRLKGGAGAKIAAELVVEVVKELGRDASLLAPASARPHVKGKPLSKVLGRVRQDANKNFRDCARVGGCR